jgi:hypothetical protein
MPNSLNVKKIILLLTALGYFPFILFYVFILALVGNSFFDFLYARPLVLNYLFFLFLITLIGELSNILRILTFSFIFEKRRCTRRFLRLMCIFEAPNTELEGVHGIAPYGIFFASAALLRPDVYRHEMQHVRDGVLASLLIYSGSSVPPIAALVLRGVKEGVYPIDVAPLFIALFPWTFLWLLLVQAVFEFRAYRYADGLSFKEALQRLLPYTADKKFGNAAFQSAVVTLTMYWTWDVIITFFKNPPADSYHAVATLLASIATPIVLAVVLSWALDVFTRRLFGEALGKFLFASFIAGAILSPLLGLPTTFLFSWAMFGRAREALAATAVAALALFAILLPGLVWTWASLSL